MDIVCCCLVLFPIVWSIKQLRDASGEAEQMTCPVAACASAGSSSSRQQQQQAAAAGSQVSIVNMQYRPVSPAKLARAPDLSTPPGRPACLPGSPAETDGKVVRTLVKLTLFRQFYIMVGAPAVCAVCGCMR